MSDDLRRDSMADENIHVLPVYTPGAPPPTYDASNDAAAALRPIAISYATIVFHPGLGAEDEAESSRGPDQVEEAVAMEPMSEAADRRVNVTRRVIGWAAIVTPVILVIGIVVGLAVGLRA
ncbi:hypothetical protein LTR56_021346 [Elasticomyces elasticus]|nr:hypothetical protein LTR56_021346 [Elasticomyces elasticus]KAK3631687.1 hypothetical protein LTR22_020977 [Elasticomyces elasticus]KAK4909554.1 hypothetical protein LTR49_021671 [Elasticomyces elasticus]KAK5754327.1 hypothetical protein LTS12_015618 [Elasticomyces elasticus]